MLPEFAEKYKMLTAQTSIPLAVGKRMFSKNEFKRVFESGGLSIVQPDLSHAEGIMDGLPNQNLFFDDNNKRFGQSSRRNIDLYSAFSRCNPMYNKAGIVGLL